MQQGELATAFGYKGKARHVWLAKRSHIVEISAVHALQEHLKGTSTTRSLVSCFAPVLCYRLYSQLFSCHCMPAAHPLPLCHAAW